MLTPQPAGAEKVDVYLMPVMDAGEADGEMSALLRKAVTGHAGVDWNVLPVAAGGAHGCKPGKSCAVVRTARKGGTYKVSLVAGNGEVLATRSVQPPEDAPAGDVADTLAIKIVFLMEKFHIPLLEKKGPVAPPVEPPVEKKPKPPPEPEPPPPPEPEPPPPEPPPPEPEPPPVEPPPVVQPEPPVRYRLTFDGVQTTGFSPNFNTGGLEPGLLLVIHEVIGVRLDVGVQLGGAKRKKLCLEAVTLPVSLMAGYRLTSGKLTVGFSAGIMMLAMWFDYYAETCVEDKPYVRLGAAARIDIEVRIGERATLGFFVRPEVFTDEVIVEGTRIMHFVTLTSGLSLHYDLGSAGGAS